MALPIAVEGGLAASSSMVARPFMKNLLTETAKEALAARGDVTKMDVNDILTGAVTTKMGSGAKAIGGLWSAFSDVTINDGLRTGFDGTKNMGRIVIDGVFEMKKSLMDEMGDMGGISEIQKNVMEVGIDQAQTEANEQLDKVVK